MKNIAKYLFAISAAAFTFAACEKEAEIKPGEPELDNCYGVYFPVQEASGDHIYNPTQDKVLEITVARTNTEGAITVPVTASFTDPKGPTDVFTASDVVFADGQAETTFTVNFDNAEEGVKYAGHFVIEDNQYASIYSKNSIGLDFTVMCVEMLNLKKPNSEEDATVTFTLGWWGLVVEANIKYYEVNDVRTCETFNEKVIVSDNSDAGDVGFWGGGEDNHLQFTWFVKKVSDEGYQAIDVPKQYLGFDYDDWLAKPIGQAGNPIFVYDWFHFLITDGGYPGGWPDWEGFLDRNPGVYDRSYYDGNGGFYLNLRYYIPGLGGWTPDTFDTVGICEGYTRVDYSLDLETDYSDGGETPVYVEAGVDIKTIKYEVFEGKFSGIQTSNKIEELLKDDKTMTEVALEYDDEYEVNYTTLLLSPEKSGDYTVIVLAYDEAGKPQASDGISIHHITAEDAAEKAVVVSVFTEDTPARYQNLHKWDSFAYGISGENLTEVHVGIFTEATISQYGGSAVMNAVKSDAKEYGASEEDLAAINADGGFYDILKGLAAKTTYYIIVWATNGDLDAFAIDSYTTEKLPYVWNSLGKGTLTDGFLLPDWSMEDATVACDVYEEQTTPGLYMVTGFQLELAAIFYGVEDPSELLPYEGENANWWNAEIVVDATDPAAVKIEQQQYGIYTNSTYQYPLIWSIADGTLADGAITFPANGLVVGYTGNGKAYYANPNGTFKITLPEAAEAPALTNLLAGSAKNAEPAHAASKLFVEPKVKYERDPQPVKVSAKVVYTRNVKESGRKASLSVATPSLVK